ncbi:MAG: NAD(P)/FAD-dependent oxidoreductase [Solirubrobacterales bacterium]|nr:NAD(P)/FAD-dependent oxidoreductase [Solirubrobacterales bacterium]
MEVEVAVVGSGFSGLGMAIRLRQEGITDFVVLERTDDVGGTWHVNTYPGCGCDVPSNLYSFSFAPNPGWRNTYSSQPEIGAYLRRCADDLGVRPHVHTNTLVTGADWDDAAARWNVETTGGTVRARVLVTAAGPLFEPKAPELPGLQRFAGRVFHSARWDHDYDLAGKRVAVVGTGASAIQLVPEIAREVQRLHVFQRTAPWVMPHPSRPTTKAERWLFRRVPALQRLARAGVYAGRESFVLGFVKQPRLMRLAERVARAHIRKQVSDPELRRRVTPDYTIGCKRILPSNRWYPALGRDNVQLVTDGIAEVRERSIVTAAGEAIDVDAIIFGTGFRVTDMPIASLVRGRDGRSLDDIWQGSPRAHLGTAIPGFPNLFMLLGPNTGLGHGSMVYMIESQVAYVIDALRTMRRRDAAAVELRPEVLAASAADVDARAEGTVWNTGCSSWYLDASGRNATLWPDWTFRFRRQLRSFDADSYELRPAAAPAVAAGAVTA